MFRHLFRILLRAQRSLLVWGGITCLLGAVWCALNRDAIATYLDKYRERNHLREQVEKLERDVEHLEREKQAIERGGFESEKAARETLRLSKPGEVVLFLDYPDKGEEGEDTSPIHRPKSSAQLPPALPDTPLALPPGTE